MPYLNELLFLEGDPLIFIDSVNKPQNFALIYQNLSTFRCLSYMDILKKLFPIDFVINMLLLLANYC